MEATEVEAEAGLESCVDFQPRNLSRRRFLTLNEGFERSCDMRAFRVLD